MQDIRNMQTVGVKAVHDNGNVTITLPRSVAAALRLMYGSVAPSRDLDHDLAAVGQEFLGHWPRSWEIDTEVPVIDVARNFNRLVGACRAAA